MATTPTEPIRTLDETLMVCPVTFFSFPASLFSLLQLFVIFYQVSTFSPRTSAQRCVCIYNTILVSI